MSADKSFRENCPLLWRDRTDKNPEPVLLTANSSFPSQLKSPAMSAFGSLPTGDVADGTNPPLALFIRTLTVLSSQLATAMSGNLSPSKSPTVIAIGHVPTANVERWKVPFPLFLKTLTVKETRLATAKSIFPSLSKSPVTTETGHGLDRNQLH